jgi:hypothetical protein
MAAAAEPAFAQGIEVGVKAGMTSATISPKGIPGLDPGARIGGLAGGWISFGGDLFRLQPEVFWIRRRFESPVQPTGKIAFTADAIDLPVLLVARFRSGEKARPSLFAGPFFSFISDVTQTFNGVKTDLTPQIKATDSGVTFGFGVDVAAGRGAMVVDTRLAIGLRDISEPAATRIYTRAFMASIGYRF